MDYANRKRPAKRTPQKKKPAPVKKPVPWLVVLIAVALVGGFVWMLKSIAGKGDSAAQQRQVAPEISATAQPPAEPLPQRPEERWEYIEELENREVIVDVPEREIGPPKVMQCASFRKLDDAQQMRAQIAMVGLESLIRTTDGQNGQWHRVMLGPYETKREAERDRHKLERARIFGCLIWNWE
jgi:cell division protein FtsN